MLNVTKVQVFPFKENPSLGPVKGLASIEIEGAIRIRGIKIIKPANSDELVVGYPLDPFYKGEEYKNLVSFIDPYLKAEIDKQIIDRFKFVTILPDIPVVMPSGAGERALSELECCVGYKDKNAPEGAYPWHFLGKDGNTAPDSEEPPFMARETAARVAVDFKVKNPDTEIKIFYEIP